MALHAVEALRGEPGAPLLRLVGPEGTGAEHAGVPFTSVGRWRPGRPEAEAGELAGRAIEVAAGRARDGEVAGLVTAPIDKHALRAGGYRHPGHTEMLAELAGGVPVAMLMAAERTPLGGALRVVLATTHLRLADVPRALSIQTFVTQTRLLGTALQDGWGIARPALALCAVNPHASDGGLFGDEEARLLEPALAQLREEGWSVTGPVPADTVFVRALRGEFDGVVVPYHDVGMAAFKTASFGHGVNVTLGLPFVRTSPDHGTALDIAGRGVADAGSMLEAVRLAARLAASPLSARWR